MALEEKPTVKEAAELLIATAEFITLNVHVRRTSIVLALNVQTGRLDILNEFGIVSEYESAIGAYLIKLLK